MRHLKKVDDEQASLAGKMTGGTGGFGVDYFSGRISALIEQLSSASRHRAEISPAACIYIVSQPGEKVKRLADSLWMRAGTCITAGNAVH